MRDAVTRGGRDRRRIAVVGAGVSGLTAAHLLQREHDVTLYEAQPRLGGHAHTHDVVTREDRVVPVDSGFIVYNERTYPNLVRLFGELGVETQPTEMSMSIRCDGCGLEYSGARGFGGLFAQGRRGADPAFLRMLLEVKRFHRSARRLIGRADPADGADVTLGEFLARGRYSTMFVHHFMVPVVACVWSCPPETALDYPATYLFRFLDHHGFLSVVGSPQWRTVVGGSRAYVERAAKELSATRLSTPVRSISRVPGAASAGVVEVHDDDDARATYDGVVVATHADEALALLADPTREEQRVLGAFGYSENVTVLHADDSLLPRSPRARASWNYLLERCDGDAAQVKATYDMNRLHRLDEVDHYLVTLNADDRIDPDAVIERMVYTHPIYTPASVAAQRELPGLDRDGVVFAGAYHGWGFHEDGCASGVRAASSFGVEW